MYYKSHYVWYRFNRFIGLIQVSLNELQNRKSKLNVEVNLNFGLLKQLKNEVIHQFVCIF